MITKEEAKNIKENKLSRREVITSGLAGIGSLALVSVLKPTRLLAQPSKTTAVAKRYAMVIDLRRCIGCHACAVACKSENNVYLGFYRSHVNSVEITYGGHNTNRFFVPRQCNHCKHPACIKVCPVEATYKREDGVVTIRKERCIGCRYCMMACPYGARYFGWHRGELEPDGLAWPSHIYGVVDKCDFCAHRIDNGVEPACVNTCLPKARIFGDLNDPNSKVAKMISTIPVSVLAPELGTEPSVFYVGLHNDAAHAALKAGTTAKTVRLNLDR